MDPISFYDPDQENGWLANFSNHAIQLDGVLWPSVEHYFQASKFLGSDAMIAALIKAARTPTEAKQIAKENFEKKRKDWEDVRICIMRKAVKAKFLQHPDLKALLLDTNTARIVEDARDDFFWGIADGTGSNMMGQILESLRQDLKTNLTREETGND